MLLRRGIRLFATESGSKTTKTTWDPLQSLQLNHPSLVLLENQCNSRNQLKQILAQIMRVNLIGDTFPMSRLILFSAITFPENIDLAKLLFLNFTPNPNVFVYNTMISSSSSKKEMFGLYSSMIRRYVSPDRQTFLNLMKASNFLSEMKQIHCHIIVSGCLSLGNYLWNSLVKFYLDLGSLGFAEKLFDVMPEPDASSFNTMIVGYAKKGFSLEALELYYKMVSDNGIEPDEYTVLGLLVCCGHLSDIKLGKGVHGWIVRRRLSSSSDLILSNALLDMYLKCKESGLAKEAFNAMKNKDMRSWNVMVGGFVKLEDMKAAQAVFDQMLKRDLVSWNSLLLGYSKNGYNQRHVRELFYEMLIVEKVLPDRITIVSLINGAANNGELSQGRWIHGLAIRLRFNVDAFLGSALIAMYCKCGNIDRAFMVFNTVSEKDVTLWTSMITGFAYHGNGKQALQLFKEMQEEGIVTPNKVTVLAVLTACSHSGLVEDGLQVFKHMKEEFGIEPETEHYGSLVDMLCRAGRVKEAKEMVEKKMPRTMRATQSMWGSILSACRDGGDIDIETAEIALKELVNLEPEKEGGYVMLSNVYASAGRFGYSDKTRGEMESRGVKKVAGFSSVVGVEGIHNSFVATAKKQNHPRWVEIKGMLQNLCNDMKLKLDLLNLLET